MGKLSPILMLATNSISLKQESMSDKTCLWVRFSLQPSYLICCALTCRRWHHCSDLWDFQGLLEPLFSPLSLAWVLFSLGPQASLRYECTSISCPQRLQGFRTFCTNHLLGVLELSSSGVCESTICSIHVVACSMSHLSKLILP